MSAVELTKARAAHVLLLDHAAARADEALRAAGIKPVLLKGAAIARWLYDDGQFRFYSDIDLLVPADRAEDGARTLARIGYRDVLTGPTERESSAHARILRAPAAAAIGHSAAPSRAGGRTVTIDLHHSFHGIGAPDVDCWRLITTDAEEVIVAGHRIAVPSMTAATMLIALHAMAHGPNSETSVADLDRAITRVPDDVWRLAHALATRLDAAPGFAAGLTMTPAGRELAQRLGVEEVIDASSRLRASGLPPVAGGLERLARARGFGARAKLILWALFPSPGFMSKRSPLARRGRGGLAIAYVVRPFWLAAKLAGAVRAMTRARREARDAVAAHDASRRMR